MAAPLEAVKTVEDEAGKAGEMDGRLGHREAEAIFTAVDARAVDGAVLVDDFCRRTWSIRAFRAIVKIQVDGLPIAALNFAA